ncbi:DUF3892 domain-containing protein [Bdellovibrio sp. HCB337]|uniref:DUF3892 domain-containing protein n=1 Tax=Bdellovibrio sp. HCB337 TaxID=3394358 RepID=UPI0039A5FE4F
MADIQITCITLSGGKSHEHITHVGNPSGRSPVADIIAWINNRTHTFYVIDPRTGKRAQVGVVNPTSGKPYIRTYADGVWGDNLLSLPLCS